MNVSMILKPIGEDWAFAKRCALVTVGKQPQAEPTLEWKHAILKARHSPIRTLQFAFLLEGIPYYVSTHLARHVHATPFIRSQRNDRQDSYDRNAARQDAPVDMIWYLNAEELMTVANKRLCLLADPATQNVVHQMCDIVIRECPEFDGLLYAACAYGECREMHPCCEKTTCDIV